MIGVLQEGSVENFSGGTFMSQAVALAGVTAGSTIVVFLTAFHTGGTPPTLSVTDDKGGVGGGGTGAYTLLDQPEDVTIPESSASFYLANSAGGTVTITGHWGGGIASSYGGVWAMEIGGAATSSPIDGHTAQNQASPGTGTDAVTAGNVTSSNQPALVVGWSFCNVGGANKPAAGTGFTSTKVAFNTDARSEYKRVTAAGTQAATFTALANNRHNNFVIVVDEIASPAAARNALMFGAGA